MMFKRLKTIHIVESVLKVRVFCGLIGLFYVMGPASAQMGGFSAQPVTYQSFVPQSFAKSPSAKVGTDSAPEAGAQVPQTIALATQMHRSVFAASDSFARKSGNEVFEAASFTPVSAMPARKPVPRKQGLQSIAQEGRSVPSDQQGAFQSGADQSRALPLQPILQDVLSAAQDYERLKNKTILLDVARGGGAGKTAGKWSDTKSGETEEAEPITGKPFFDCRRTKKC